MLIVWRGRAKYYGGCTADQKHVVSNLGSDVEASLGPSESLALNANPAPTFGTMRETATGSEMQLLTDDNADVPPCPTTDTDPTLAPVPLERRTFATSNYKRFYDGAQAPVFQHYLLAAVNTMLLLFAKRRNPALQQHELENDVNQFMAKIQADAFEDGTALREDVGAVAEYLWTSAKTHAVVNYMQLCSVLNAVIRDDVSEEVGAAAIFFRGINTRRVTRVSKAAIDTSYPRNGETWRGGGFRTQHRAFFERMVGKKYRVPGFLATSGKRSVAAKFAFEAFEDDRAHPCVIWRITVDPRGELHPQYRVKHMTFVVKTLVAGEEEYLFAPYSVFTLVSTEWSANLSKPHEFTVRAAWDNKKEDEKLPLTPWY